MPPPLRRPVPPTSSCKRLSRGSPLEARRRRMAMGLNRRPPKAKPSRRARSVDDGLRIEGGKRGVGTGGREITSLTLFPTPHSPLLSFNRNQHCNLTRPLIHAKYHFT